jgi:hypothetical protein
MLAAFRLSSQICSRTSRGIMVVMQDAWPEASLISAADEDDPASAKSLHRIMKNAIEGLQVKAPADERRCIDPPSVGFST